MKILLAALVLCACAGPREYTVPIYILVNESDHVKIEVRLQVKADVPQNYDVKPTTDLSIPLIP